MIIWGMARGNLNRRAEESGWFAIILLGVLFGFQDFLASFLIEKMAVLMYYKLYE